LIMKIFFTSVFILCAGFTSVFGQGSKSLKRKIAQLEAKGHFIEAADLHMSLHDEGERDASIQAGMNLYKVGKYKEALYYLQHADSMGTLDHSDEVFAYFQSLKSLKRYTEADELIRTHLPKLPNSPEIILNAEKGKLYEKLMGYGKTKITSVPVNTAFSEFGPAVLDGWLYFESTRTAKGNEETHGLNGQPYFNLYAHAIDDPSEAVVMPQGEFGKAQVTISSGGKQTLSIPEEINKSHHDGPVYLTPEGKHMFYTTNWDHAGKTEYKNPHLNLGYSSSALEKSQEKLVGKIHLNIYYSTHENNIWSEPVSFPYNNDDWSNQHAFFDEKTSTLYFSSNMPGSVGGFDIWKSVLKGTEWSKPENMGPQINTVKHEVFPLLSPEGYLIFSSNGWPGLGGLDLFVSELPDYEPINLMAGMNTEMDDFGMVFIKKGIGYFVSNRKESVGDDDIFEFEMDMEDVIAYSRPSINLFLANAVSGEKISGSVEISQRGAGKTINVSTQGALLRPAPGSAELKASAPGFYPTTSQVKKFSDSEPTIISLNPVPPPVPERLPLNIVPVYFDYNKSNIRKDAAAELDRLAETLNANPTLSLEASSHTDCRGSLEYNQKLSERRLKSSLDYLRKRIVNPERLSGLGLGENKPASQCDCQNSTALCNEQLHQSNRRTEFVVIKY
jgi:outer membrane protein OmpA-like peptidoglycan-associated protein/tetratricopeptide (TPR) repeat protein